MAMTPSENASSRDGPMTCSLMAEFVAQPAGGAKGANSE
jgi:hypothetical protein